VHGLTRTIGTSADGDSAADAALIPLQTRQQPMDLPFKLGEIGYAGQSWDGIGSHNGLAEVCWDLTCEGGTDGVMLVSAAPGEVAEVRESAPSGKSEYANHVDVKQAENEFASYIHLKQNQVPVAKGDLVTQGQEIGRSGDTGTGVGNFHLHVAVSDKPDLTEGFVTIPVAFSDYEVRRRREPVARGVPIDGDIIRNPPTPAFAARSLGPGSAVSRGTNQLDLVATDSQGRIWIARWVPRRYFNNWDRWRPVLTDLGATRPVGVASRSSGRLDIVSAHAAGSVHTGGWNRDYNYGLWGGWWRIKDLVARGNAPVSIVARDARGNSTSPAARGEAGGGSETSKPCLGRMSRPCRGTPTSWTSSPFAPTARS
jgi:murein DD-endopeptidase MepM/ murein hydrolase activator NlpD